MEVIRTQGKDVSRGMLKGLEKRKQNLEVKLQKIAYSIEQRTDDVVDFRMMGIDHLFVDESHQFKNLMFNTRHDRVAGLGNSEGSRKALNMLLPSEPYRSGQAETWERHSCREQQSATH